MSMLIGMDISFEKEDVPFIKIQTFCSETL